MDKKLEIISSGKKFMYVYGADAAIIHHLLGYKIVDRNRCGFPNTVLNKVKITLEDNKISYVIKKENEPTVLKDYKGINNYETIKEKAISSLAKDEQIDMIIEKIKRADAKTMQKIMEFIQNV